MHTMGIDLQTELATEAGMSVRSKVIATCVHAPIQATQLAETLNDHATAGWRFQDASTVVTRKGGAVFALGQGYYADTYYLTLTRATGKYEYRCEMIKREKDQDKDIELINCRVDEMANDGFDLVKLLHATCISPNEERPTPGTIGHIMIFERMGD